jgi:hypothetical protein
VTKHAATGATGNEETRDEREATGTVPRSARSRLPKHVSRHLRAGGAAGRSRCPESIARLS